MTPTSRLTIASDLGVQGGHRMVLCTCECGKAISIRRSSVVSGHTLSCGCIRRDPTYSISKAGGLARDPRYFVVQKAIDRCYDPDHPQYPGYGGRGITVCDRWRFGANGRSGIECFCEDMGRRPSAAHSLDRIDNDGPYAPDNCRWATAKQQQRNRRTNALYQFSDKTRCLIEISELCGINYQTLVTRLRRGWAPDRAFSTPPLR